MSIHHTLIDDCLKACIHQFIRLSDKFSDCMSSPQKCSLSYSASLSGQIGSTDNAGDVCVCGYECAHAPVLEYTLCRAKQCEKCTSVGVNTNSSHSLQHVA